MKKLIYLFFAIGFFTSCDPMDDLHEEIDATIDDTVRGEIAITLEESDYETAGVEGQLFSSLTEAELLIPEVLEERFPAWGEGSIAYVTFNYSQEIAAYEEYTVTSDDYTAVGESYPNFNSQSDLYNFLNYKYPDAEDGTLVLLTYDYFSGGVNTFTEFFFYNQGTWMRYYTFTDEDYSAMDQNYPNFESHEVALNNIPIYLKNELYPYAQEGDVANVAYELHIGGGDTEFYRLSYTFDGTNWVLVGNESVLTETVQFGHNGQTWEPDNTITYTLTSADFDLISDALEDQYQNPAWSAGNYDNFDRRQGNQNYWSNEMILEALNVVLDNIHPDAEEGQKYVVTYAVYTGSAGTESMNVIKQDGEWVLNE